MSALVDLSLTGEAQILLRTLVELTVKLGYIFQSSDERARLYLDFQHTESPAVSTEPRTWQVIRGALQFCDANYRGKVHLPEVAAALGYSPSYLSRLFSRHVGHSVSDHLRQLRMNTARHLLENSDLSITEIALSVGYTDPSNFSHAFARDTGAAPTACRRHLRGL